MRGERNASSFIVIQGFIAVLGKQSILNSPRSGIYSVEWKDGRLPDGVKRGEYCTIIGQLVTFDLGRGFKIIKAEGLKAGAVKRFKQILEGERSENLPDSGKI